MEDPLRYQSPIPLCIDNDDLFYVKQSIRIHGKNKGAEYIEVSKMYQVKEKIIMKIDGKPYQLDEYHFHVPAEHTINGKTYPAEVHFVFYELSDEFKRHRNKTKSRTENGCCNYDMDDNILVIGRVIKDTKKCADLSKLQVNIPSSYFEYDGSLTGTGDETVPVRWIVGNRYIKLPLDKIYPIAKTARPLQPLDDRILLFDNCHC